MRREIYLKGLYNYIATIGDMAISTGRQVIIWGYSKGGAFVRFLLEEYDQRVSIGYIIDQCMQIPANCEPKIYRGSILEYINCENYILLSTVKDYSNVSNHARQYGFVDDVNMFDVRSKIGVSYIDYLQISNHELDFTYVTEKERPDVYSNPKIRISTPFEMTSLDKVFSEICQLENYIDFFDYGCGKGQILFSAYMNNIDKVSGIELVPEICDQAKKNMDVLGVPANIICGDATQYNDIDSVNVFYFNNPFMGNLFESVINNICDSYRRTKRRIHIVYLNPVCHKVIINSGIFSLVKQIYVDVGDPIANFYCTEKGTDKE